MDRHHTVTILDTAYNLMATVAVAAQAAAHTVCFGMKKFKDQLFFGSKKGMVPMQNDNNVRTSFNNMEMHKIPDDSEFQPEPDVTIFEEDIEFEEFPIVTPAIF